MAVIIGGSGTEREIKSELARLGIRLSAIYGLPAIQHSIQGRLRSAGPAANALWEHALAALEARLAEEERLHRLRLAEDLAGLEGDMRTARATLEFVSRLLADAPPFLKTLLNPRALLMSLALLRRYRIARQSLKSAEKRLRARMDLVPSSLHDARATLASHVAGKEPYIAGRIAWWRSVDDCLSRIQEAGMLAGAEAELEVIRHLAQLPDRYVVLNDLHVQSARWTRYRKRSLLSAQIDHLVVGPSGIFIIETKNWSRSFLRSGDFFDPYEQVGRAAHLCYIRLKSAGLPPKNRSIIASKGALPPKPSDSYSKVLLPRELVGYIASFPHVLDDGTIQRISHAFR